jgi:hypothetical protein
MRWVANFRSCFLGISVKPPQRIVRVNFPSCRLVVPIFSMGGVVPRIPSKIQSESVKIWRFELVCVKGRCSSCKVSGAPLSYCSFSFNEMIFVNTFPYIRLVPLFFYRRSWKSHKFLQKAVSNIWYNKYVIILQIVHVSVAWLHSSWEETLLLSTSIRCKWKGNQRVCSHCRHSPVAIICGSLSQFLCRQCSWFTFYPQHIDVGKTHTHITVSDDIVTMEAEVGLSSVLNTVVSVVCRTYCRKHSSPPTATHPALCYVTHSAGSF